ncbi:MAG: HlyD family secretion protein [Pirellulaceae bacterium]
MAVDSLLELEIDDDHVPLSDLDRFGFKLAKSSSRDFSVGEDFDATIAHPSGKLRTKFRVRRENANHYHCMFRDLSIGEQEAVSRLLSDIEGGQSGDALEELSYDELARGDAVAKASKKKPGKSKATETPASKPQGPQRNIKALVALLLVVSMLAVTVLVAVFVQMRYSVQVGNSVLVGNYQPINTRYEGELAEVYVREGQDVHAGQLIAQLKNPDLQSSVVEAESELNTAIAEKNSVASMLGDYQNTLKFARLKLDQDLAAEKAELKRANYNFKIAQLEADRLAPLAADNSIPATEHYKAVNLVSASEAEIEGIQARIERVALAQEACESGILIVGDRIDDRMMELKASRESLQAKVDQAEKTLEQAKQRLESLGIKAPSDGKVFAVYRHSGEFVKIAEEVIALSRSGQETWAIGQVPVDQVTSIKPGQEVKVEIPSLQVKTTGKVTAVGHRAVYGKGGYTAEFRGGSALDVPIRVDVEGLPKDIPSGMRLKMTVKLEFKLPWLEKAQEKVESLASMAGFAQ